MANEHETIADRLAVIAATANMLAKDQRANKLWPDELRVGIGVIRVQAEHLSRAVREMR